MQSPSSFLRARPHLVRRLALGGGKLPQIGNGGIHRARARVPCCASHAVAAGRDRSSRRRIAIGGNLPSFLGERMLADNFLIKSVVVREIEKSSSRSSKGLSQTTCEQEVSEARYLSAVVGSVAARRMTAGSRRQWVAEPRTNRSNNLNGPGDALPRSPRKHVRVVSISMQCAKLIIRCSGRGRSGKAGGGLKRWR
jgi:hypothetical protein